MGNMEYNPISFLQKDIYEKEGTCISQMFEATTVFNNIEYELELSYSCQYYMAYLPKIQSEYKNFYSHYPAFTSFLVYTLH